MRAGGASMIANKSRLVLRSCPGVRQRGRCSIPGRARSARAGSRTGQANIDIRNPGNRVNDRNGTLPPGAWWCEAGRRPGESNGLAERGCGRRFRRPHAAPWSAVFATHDFGGQGEDGLGVGVDLVG